MNLFESMMTDCVIMDESSVSDGAGGIITTWKEGAEFKCAITMDTTMQAQIALKDSVTSIYTVTTYKNTKLKFHTVFKRISDGRIFRTTSDVGDIESPSVSRLNMAQYKAEKWELTE